jgi:hypothetical protein
MSTATAPPAKPPSNWIKRTLSDRIVWIGLAVWAVFSAAIPYLAHEAIPFDQPALAALPYRARVMIEIMGPIFAFIFIGVAYALTRRRFVDLAARAPERSVALRETLGLLAYGAVVLIGGVFVGSLAGNHRIGLHLAGSMFGLTNSVSPREVWAWSLYNFTFYAAIPYLWFRRRGYSREQLCLKSSNPINDTLVILVVLALGLVVTYAALHLSEYWTRYDTLNHATLSVIFIVLFFGGPGMVKAYLTLRTGNAWVHLWGYHVIWPHVTGDTPLFVKIFELR